MEASEEKEAQVAAWLKKIFGDHPIPQYEVNARTTEILHHLSERNRVRDRDGHLVVEDLKQKASEYESEGEINCRVFEYSFFFFSFLSAVNDLTSDLFSAKSKNEELKLELAKLEKKLTASLVLEKCLRDDLKKSELQLSTERAKVNSRLQNMDFLKAKSEESRFGIRALEVCIFNCEYLCYSVSLFVCSFHPQKLAELKQQTIPLKKKLESYLDLMPDPSLAQVKIEEAKRELVSSIFFFSF
ncbi:PREDICTED: HAUS augmin-like complex subunit 1 [Myotis davidii]|uniref:HAUS augmin-like complex subunit 1 n=1 Tax=Myotis davidii TaxID=225400 RepID=UPI0007677A14|nr:PREDICTED: HAUS augmin-like complex subunit 1 [Myotis davidii]